jgi:glycosyltransferase 2 family protein
MASGTRLLQVGATVAEFAAAQRVRPVLRITGRLVALTLVVLLALRLWQLWRRDPVDFGELDGAVFAAAVFASVVAVSSYGFVWLYLLRCLGTRAPLSWITLFFKSQLAKYLPGSVWQYAARVGLARSRGVPVQRGVVSVTAEVGYSALAAAAASSLVLGWGAASGVLLGLAGLLALVVAFRPRLTRLLAEASSAGSHGPIDRQNVLAALQAAPSTVGLYLVVWGLYGIAFWTTGRALFAIPASDIPRYIGVFALAWLAGLVAFFAPGGIGVREAVIAALLTSHLGEANAIVVAATSRIVLSAIDLVAGVASFGVPAPRSGESRPVGAGQ